MSAVCSATWMFSRRLIYPLIFVLKMALGWVNPLTCIIEAFALTGGQISTARHRGFKLGGSYASSARYQLSAAGKLFATNVGYFDEPIITV